MAKTIKSIGFTQNDEALVEKITIYQKKNSLSFIAAVRELCETALKMETIVKSWGERWLDLKDNFALYIIFSRELY